MKSRLLLACLFGVFFAPYAYGADNPFSGGIFLGGDALNLDHQSAKFNEYNAIAPGMVGGGNVSYDTDKYHFDSEGAYLGEKDMYVRLKGGKWGAYKFSLYYTEFPHNYSFEDRSIYTNPGSQNLTLPGRASATPRQTPACGRARPSIMGSEEGHRRLPGCDRHIALLLQCDGESAAAGRGDALVRP